MPSKKEKYLLQAVDISNEFNRIKNAIENPRIRIKKNQFANTSMVILYSGAKGFRAKISPETLQSFINSLRILKESLRDLINKIDRRSLHFFKTGNVKESIDRIISVKKIVNLTREVKLCQSQLQTSIFNHKIKQTEEKAEVALDCFISIKRQ